MKWLSRDLLALLVIENWYTECQDSNCKHFKIYIL